VIATADQSVTAVAATNATPSQVKVESPSAVPWVMYMNDISARTQAASVRQ
jgi:2,3-bisphosphoglycerate-independent phosphoglycerate mutase